MKQYFRKQYFEVLDLLVQELDRRFDQPSIHLLQEVEDILLKSANGDAVEIPQSVRDVYQNDIDFCRLELHLKMLPDLLKKSSNPTKVTNIKTICEAMVAEPVAQKLLSEVHKLLKIYLTVPATSATSERTNSILKRIKNYLRSTMTQTRMNNVLICHAMKDRTDSLSLENIAKLFVSVNDTRKKYFGKL